MDFFLNRIQRSIGTFNNVTVEYEVLSSSKIPIARNSEFINTKGNVMFLQGSTTRNLNLQVRKDNIPELNETFYVRLTSVSGTYAFGLIILTVITHPSPNVVLVYVINGETLGNGCLLETANIGREDLH